MCQLNKILVELHRNGESTPTMDEALQRAELAEKCMRALSPDDPMWIQFCTERDDWLALAAMADTEGR